MRFIKCIYFWSLLCLSFNIAQAVTRSEIVQRALNWQYTNNWAPIKDNEQFGSYSFVSNYRTAQNGGSTPYNVEAYVYGGNDGEDAFTSRISTGICPGGINVVPNGPTTKWLYDNGYSPETKLAGIDCSGFVSSCWTIARTNTTGLSNLSLELNSATNLKAGDILNIAGTHVRLCVSDYSEANNTINWAEATPPCVQVVLGQNIPIGYLPRSIFPQFSAFKPADGETVAVSNKPVTVKITIEGSGSIENVKMWLDDEEVVPEVHGGSAKRNVSYKPDVLAPGDHVVKVYCNNTVNGVTYEDFVSWKFRYGGAAVKITDAIPQQLTEKQRFIFYSKSFAYDFLGSESIILSCYEDGTGYTCVDDSISIIVTRPDGTIAQWGYKYTQKRFPEPIRPVDITSIFAVGLNQVRAELWDVYGSAISSTSLWLVGDVKNGGSALLKAPQNSFTDAEAFIDTVNFNHKSPLHTTLPTTYELSESIPNPCYENTIIKYQLPQYNHVSVNIYNLNGQLVRTLVDEIKSAGIYQCQWNGKDDAGQKVSKGMYLYRMTAGNFSATKKLILLK